MEIPDLGADINIENIGLFILWPMSKTTHHMQVTFQWSILTD